MNNKLMVSLLMVGLVLLSGCDNRVEVDRQVKEYEVIGIRPPKRFYVDLQDVQTGQIHEREYVSKRCSNWKRLKMSSKWQFTEITYRDDKGNISYRIDGVHGLCAALSKLPD